MYYQPIGYWVIFDIVHTIHCTWLITCFAYITSGRRSNFTCKQRRSIFKGKLISEQAWNNYCAWQQADTYPGTGTNLAGLMWITNIHRSWRSGSHMNKVTSCALAYNCFVICKMARKLELKLEFFMRLQLYGDCQHIHAYGECQRMVFHYSLPK